MNKKLTASLRAAASIAVLSLTGLASAQTQYYSPQGPFKYSTMFGLDWEPITDVEFAGMAQTLLLQNGSADTRGAMFLFEQCFSGGMFNDLDSALGSEVRWVGGSAARYDEVSYGQGNSNSFPLDYWVRGLEIALRENDTMINTVNLARLLDERGPSGTGAEHPQSIYRNGGENINHRTIGASSQRVSVPPWSEAKNRKSASSSIDDSSDANAACRFAFVAGLAGMPRSPLSPSTMIVYGSPVSTNAWRSELYTTWMSLTWRSALACPAHRMALCRLAPIVR